MELSEAMATAVRDNGWSVTKLAAEANVTEAAARRWLTGAATPAGDVVVRLQKILPGFNDLLLHSNGEAS